MPPLLFTFHHIDIRCCSEQPTGDRGPEERWPAERAGRGCGGAVRTGPGPHPLIGNHLECRAMRPPRVAGANLSGPSRRRVAPDGTRRDQGPVSGGLSHMTVSPPFCFSPLLFCIHGILEPPTLLLATQESWRHVPPDPPTTERALAALIDKMQDMNLRLTAVERQNEMLRQEVVQLKDR